MNSYKPVRVGIYCRVSTKRDQTTESQLLDLRKYCEGQGWQIVEECVDEGISGARDDRPGLQTIMQLARRGKINVLLVWRFDRFARSLTHLVNTLEELNERGVGFASFQEQIDTSTAQGKMVFGIMASLAEFERSLIRDRVLSGLRRAREKGVRLGRPPGEPKEADQARKMQSEGLSQRKIAAVLKVGKSTIGRWVARKTM